MKFKIQRETLLSILNNVSKGLSNKTPMPILTGIYVKVESDKITFSATNREISIQQVVSNDPTIIIEESGDCVVPGKYFVEIIKKLEGDVVDFIVFDETTIKIITERSQFTLTALDKSLFPQYTYEGDGTPIEFESQELKKIIRQTSFAVSTSETRVVLTGVYFDLDKDNLTITATDSFRLAKKTTKLTKTYDKKGINIPGKAIEELYKILDDSDSIVKMYIVSNKAIFHFNNIAFMTRLIEGIYPDVSSLFPKGILFDIKFNKNELISAIERASLLSSTDVLNSVKLVIKDTNKVQILSNSNQIGNVEEDVYPLNRIEPLQFRIAFGSKSFLEAIKSFDSTEITISFTGEIKPFVISCEADEELKQLILPIRAF